MKIGLQEVPVYWHDVQGKLVIKLGKSGYCFGTVQDMHTHESFSTYGYDLLEYVGTIEIQAQIVSDFEIANG